MGEAGFQQRLDGKFHGILRWPQLDALWATVTDDGEPWYFYQVGDQPPQTPLQNEALKKAIDALDSLLRREHDHDYCGIVYADDPATPTLIKVYDPNNLGTSCGCSGEKFIPRWILSRDKPDRVEDQAPLPNNRRKWWQKLFSGQ